MLFCERFGWTYREYYETPADVVARWSRYLEIEAEFRKPRRK